MQCITVICLLLASFLNTAYAIDCYSCNTTYMTERNDDPCRGLETLVKCTEPAICLSATLLYEVGATKQYNAYKTCHIPQNGQECQNFLKNIQVLNRITKVDYYNNQCKTCDKTGCNKYSNAQTVLPTFLALIISYLLCKLI